MIRKKAFEIIRKKIGELGLDSVLIGKKSNIFYLTGFTGNCYLSLNASKIIIFTPYMFREEAEFIGGYSRIKIEPVRNYFESFFQAGKDFWGEKIGFEEDFITFSAYEKIKQKLSFAELVPVNGILEDLREVKSKVEIENIESAQSITDEVFEYAIGLLHEGVMERDISAEINYLFRKNGADGPAFDTIVAFGENTSRPHAVPTSRKLKKGDFALFDMGTIINGYVSDMTRTVVLGKADSERKKVYNLVLDAQKSAIESISAGQKCSDVFKKAFNMFEKENCSDYFIHSLGHGVGIEVHENPKLSENSESVLKEKSVVTVEPGIYIPGWGGVRIEDMVVVENDGCINLTHSEKKLIEI